MPLKNYTTSVPAVRSVQEIQESLAKHGAIGVLLEYEKGTGRIGGVSFQIELAGKNRFFRLPLQWREAQRVMIEQGVRRANDEDFCYRVAWRIMRDWVMVQMSLVELQIVEVSQIFLSYTIQQNGKTLYENIKIDPNKLLGDGN